jgi:prepilin-type N-terminal cleavage/methylation domain-containing protein
MRDRGVTLVELLVVVAIVSILVIALGFSYQGWQGAYKVEKATKDIYTDLTDARIRASTRNRMYFADFNFPAPPPGNGTYRIAEDTDDDGEGDADADGVIDAVHTILPPFPKTVEYPITWGPRIINFNKRGMVEPRGQALGGTICLTTTANPDYDCIRISQTRINMGRLTTQISAGGACDAANCVAK